MKALIVCPADRQAVAALARRRPLALTPFLGPPVLAHALRFLAAAGAREIRVLAADRPDEVRAFAGRGEAWGVKVEVLPESRELSRDEARAKYQSAGAAGWLPAPLDILAFDALPQLPERPLWTSPSGWQAALLAWLAPGAREKVGMREFAPGVFVGLRVRIADDAKLNAPCWIGNRVWIGPRAVIGPHTIVEDEVYVDRGAEVTGSVVGPRTYVGALTHVGDSLAWGRELLNFKSGSLTEVTDHFLLGDLAAGAHRNSSRWPGRAAALLALALASPLVLAGWWRNRGSGRPLFVRKTAVRTGTRRAMPVGDTLAYHELGGFAGLARRWPQLWRIVRGDFTWVGNRPLAPEQAAQLATEFERLWFAAPIGWCCLGDALGCADDFSDEARSHASFYTVQSGRRVDWQILGRVFCAVLRGRRT